MFFADANMCASEKPKPTITNDSDHDDVFTEDVIRQQLRCSSVDTWQRAHPVRATGPIVFTNKKVIIRPNKSEQVQWQAHRQNHKAGGVYPSTMAYHTFSCANPWATYTADAPEKETYRLFEQGQEEYTSHSLSCAGAGERRRTS